MQTNRTIIVNKDDHEQLKRLFASDIGDSAEESSLQTLREELDGATVVDPDSVPPDVITLGSSVRLSDSRSSYKDSYTLVHPKETGTRDSRLSVLAPIGSAILGYRVGDVVQWPVHNGTAHFRIEELVFQPERDAIVI